MQYRTSLVVLSLGVIILAGAGCISQPSGVTYDNPEKTVGTTTSAGFLEEGKDFVWPSAARTITQYSSQTHPALDIAGTLNTPIYAVSSGKVEQVACGDAVKGCYMLIDHGSGIKTFYSHNSKNLVSSGDTVKIGQQIALMGNTGEVKGSTGTYLHFELIVNGVRVNPLKYIIKN